MTHLIAKNLSVVLNVWGNDAPDSLKRSLKSVVAQDTKSSELIVVLDGPISSELEGVIQEFASQINRIIKIPIAGGLWSARNRGLAATKTDFVALHDADDVMHPHRLSLQLKAIEESEADVVASPVYEFHAKSEQLIGLRDLCDNSNLIRRMRWQNVINHSSVLLRRSAVMDVGGYRNVYLAEDYDLWIRMIQKNKQFFCMPQAVQAFSVDSKLTKRRGGLKFIKSELAINRTISDGGEMSVIEMNVRLMIRIVYRMSPRFVRNIHRNKCQVSKQEKYRSLSDFLAS
jgi:glycosyltransferase involved in cell wall biosynthesis